MVKKNQTEKNEARPSIPEPKPAPPTPTKASPEKPRSIVVMVTDGPVVSSAVKTTRELYMENGNDKKN